MWAVWLFYRIFANDMMQDEIDMMYMRRCLRLALNGLGRTRPNPLVGCVVVKEGRVVSEGFHQQYGGAHAERNALLRLVGVGVLNGDCTRGVGAWDADGFPCSRHQGSVAEGATLYVNLEPCSHYGHTPPCADLVIEMGVRRVVCSCDDPNPLVAGRGFAKLEAAGVEVVRHVLEEEGRQLNRRFFTFMERRRPYVILKWAESADGLMAPAAEGAYWLSTPLQNRLNHRWRTEEAAILIGSETYLRDCPQLTPRHFLGPMPRPVVVDRRGRLAGLPAHWLCLHTATPADTLAALYEQGVQSVIVEGGRRMLDAFIDCGLYDEVRVLRSPQRLGCGLSAPMLPCEAAVCSTVIC